MAAEARKGNRLSQDTKLHVGATGAHLLGNGLTRKMTTMTRTMMKTTPGGPALTMTMTMTSGLATLNGRIGVLQARLARPEMA